MSAYFYQTIILPSSLYMEAMVILFQCKLDCVCCPTAQNMAQYLYLGLRTYILLSSLILYHSPRYLFSSHTLLPTLPKNTPSLLWLQGLPIGEGNGNPLQCSCLENPRERGGWWAAVYGVAQSWIRLKWLGNSRAFLHAISFTNHWMSLQIQPFISSNVPKEGFHDCSIYNVILFHYLIFFLILCLFFFIESIYFLFSYCLSSCKKSFVFFMTPFPMPCTMPNA